MRALQVELDMKRREINKLNLTVLQMSVLATAPSRVSATLIGNRRNITVAEKCNTQPVIVYYIDSALQHIGSEKNMYYALEN